MTTPKVWTFFYGSFINREVLKKAGYTAEQYEVAKLSGFNIHIQPLANLVRSDQHCVYGIVARATHEELNRLYEYAQSGLGGTYLPEPVMVETLDGKWRAAFCYIAPALESAAPTNDYIDRIVGPAKEYGFPGWYLARLESFRPKG
jgi:cation transport regulator ChaC